MVKPVSPLRYPGGKSGLFSLLVQVLRESGLRQRCYAEPYAGGCGLALPLLYGSYVSDVFVNDLDDAVFAFWDSVLNRTRDFVEKMWDTPVSVDEWRKQREIYLQSQSADVLALGFSAFFLNRVNRSGVIKTGGIIGGLSQDGPYKIDCRFNKADLASRILRVAKYRGRIHLSKDDGVEFVKNAEQWLPKSTFFCIDPPYFTKGRKLYTSFYREGDHVKLGDQVKKLPFPWIVTYDNVPQIRALYNEFSQFEIGVRYSIQNKRVGDELLVAGPGVVLPPAVRKAALA